MKIENFNLYASMPDNAQVTITVALAGRKSFETINPARFIHDYTANPPVNMRKAIRKAHRELVKEFHVLRAKYLVAVAEGTQRIVGQMLELTDGRLTNVSFDDNFLLHFGTTKIRAEPLAAIIETRHAGMVEGVEIKMNFSEPSLYAGYVENLSIQPHRRQITTLDELEQWRLDKRGNTIVGDVKLSRLVSVATRKARRSERFLQSSPGG